MGSENSALVDPKPDKKVRFMLSQLTIRGHKWAEELVTQGHHNLDFTAEFSSLLRKVFLLPMYEPPLEIEGSGYSLHNMGYSTEETTRDREGKKAPAKPKHEADMMASPAKSDHEVDKAVSRAKPKPEVNIMENVITAPADLEEEEDVLPHTY